MKGTIKQLLTTEFGFDLDKMEIGKMYDVSEANIGVKAYDGKTGENCFSRVTHAIKKDKQSSYRIKLEDRPDFEEPVAGRHMYAIMKSYDSNEMDFGFVENLIPGASIITIDGPSKIEKIEKLEDDYVYDVETEAHNYYSNNILSHNTIGAFLPSVTGGTALKFFSSTRCRVQKMEQIKNGDEVIGIQIRVRNYKNKTSVPNRDAKMNLYFEGGFKSDNEYFDFLTRLNIIEKCPSGVYKADFLPDGKIRGAANLLEWITAPEQKELYDKLKEQVTAKLLVSNELDADNIDPEQEDIQNAKNNGVRVTKPTEAEKAEVEELAKEALEEE